MTPNLKTWLAAARPKTLWASVAPVIIGTAMAYSDGGGHLLSALAALFGAVMIQIGTNFANDYSDHAMGTDTGERLGPLRVTAAGLVTPQAMKRATIIVFGLAVLAGCYLVVRGGLPILLIGIFSILFGVLYTAGPFPLGYNGLGDIFVLIFFGFVPVWGTHYVQTLEPAVTPLVAGVPPGMFSVAILTVNNLRDIDGDRAAGKRTLAARFGRTFARTEYVACLIVAASTPILLVLVGTAPVPALLSLLFVPVSIPTVRAVLTRTDGPSLNNALAATGKLLLVYSLLFSIGWLL
ncbi:MAG: 1,4-dihydroxy-2-naphthoate polyprenyltransferase [Candidatus Zixiibacteriota bacterium]